MSDFFANLGVGILTAFKGVPMTLGISAVAVILGMIVGFLLATMRLGRFRVVRVISQIYTDIVRGTPLVVQVFIAAYGIPLLIQHAGGDFKWPILLIPGTLVCGLNSAAYMGEIIRGGLQAVDKGQMEAALSLGMKKRQAMRLVIIPQAVRIILPAIGNEFVTLIKETSILSFAGVVEIMRRGTLLSSRTFNTFEAYLGVAIVYMVFTIPLSKLILYLENRMKTE